MINKILKIMKKNNEIITPAKLEEKGISRVYLSRMEEEGIIEKTMPGSTSSKGAKVIRRVETEEERNNNGETGENS